jgi:membrane protease YdiL (CAAX protease family)
VSTALPPPARPAAGWFTDPFAPNQLRYWDGDAWTGWVAPDVARPTRATFPLSVAVIGYAVLLGGFAVSIVVSVVMYALQLPEAIIVLGGGLALYAPLVWYVRSASRDHGTGNLTTDLGLRLRWIDLAIGLGAWFAATVAQAVVVIVLQGLGLPLGNNTDTLRDVRDETSVFIAIAVIAVLVAPVVEELFFRGLLLRSFESRFVWWVAVLMQAVLFGLIHVQLGLGLGNITLLAALATVGATFGVVTDRVGSLGPAIVGHALFNAVAVIAAYVVT